MQGETSLSAALYEPTSSVVRSMDLHHHAPTREELGKMRMLVVATMLVILCVACSDADGGAETSPTQPSSTPASPSPTVPPYLESYSQQERAAYEEAVAAFEAFASRDGRFLAAGRTTSRANDFYHRYSADWAADWANLAQLANNNVKVTGPTSVEWVRPMSIQLESPTSVVVLRRCQDESNVIVTQDGEPIDQPNLETPHEYRIRMERRPDEAWWRTGPAKQVSKC